MKKLLIILLLFIFSAQGAVVASGGEFAVAADRSGMGHAASMTAPISCGLHDGDMCGMCGMYDAYDMCDLQDPSGLKVSSSIEEMSDYVAPDMAPKPLRDTAPSPPTIAPVLSSIDLPLAPPPPRACQGNARHACSKGSCRTLQFSILAHTEVTAA